MQRADSASKRVGLHPVGMFAPGWSNISTVEHAGLGMLYASMSVQARSSSLVSRSMSYRDLEVGSES